MPILYIQLHRGCMVYFVIKFNCALEDSKWRLFVDPIESNWFLKNKKKWGSGKRLSIILFIIYALFASIGMFRMLMVGEYDTITRGIIAIPTLSVSITGLILYCKYPSFDDIWLIRQENKLSVLIVSIIALLYLIVAPIAKVQTGSPWMIALWYMAVIVTITPTFTSMFWVNLKFNLPFTIFGVSKYLNDNSLPNMTHLTRTNSFTIRMRDVLENKNGFKLFARHLTKEFSIENLLFFIETNQWINMIISQLIATSNDSDNPLGNKNDDEQNVINKLLRIKLPKNAPKSRILSSSTKINDVIMNDDGTTIASQNQKTKQIEQLNGGIKSTEITIDDNDNNAYMSALKLFLKYIVNESYFCINISWEHRQELYNLFGYSDSNKTADIDMISRLKKNVNSLKELIHIFDNSRKVAYRFLANGFTRFRISDQFVERFESLSPKNSI
eukprot:55979_1